MSRTYTTIQGDMWDGIAYKELGSTDLTDALMMANRQHLGTYLFPAGVVLTIPDIEELPDASSLPPWKQVVG